MTFSRVGGLQKPRGLLTSLHGKWTHVRGASAAGQAGEYVSNDSENVAL